MEKHLNDDLNDEAANELAKFEREVMSGLKPDAEDPVLDLPEPTINLEDPAVTREREAQAAAAAQTTPAAIVQATQATDPNATAGKPVHGEEKDQGDPRAALRATRRAERRLREDNERLRQELEQARGTTANQEQVDPDLALLADEVPAAAPVIKKLLDEIKELKGQTAAQKTEAAAPAFVPEKLDPAAEKLLELNSDIEDWHADAARQTEWQLAKQIDGVLYVHPQWKDKPPAERMAEVARRVKQELGSAPSTPQTTTPARRASEPTERGIETLTDLRGGVAPSNTGPDFYSMKSDDEVMAALARVR